MALIVKDILKSRGMSVKEFADRLGINRVSLSSQLNGNPTLETLEKWARELDLTVPDLFSKSRVSINCPQCGADITIRASD